MLLGWCIGKAGQIGQLCHGLSGGVVWEGFVLSRPGNEEISNPMAIRFQSGFNVVSILVSISWRLGPVRGDLGSSVLLWSLGRRLEIWLREPVPAGPCPWQRKCWKGVSHVAVHAQGLQVCTCSRNAHCMYACMYVWSVCLPVCMRTPPHTRSHPHLSVSPPPRLMNACM